jgi:hypothetical protein
MLHNGPSLKWEGPFLFSVPLDGLENDLNEKYKKVTLTSSSHYGRGKSIRETLESNDYQRQTGKSVNWQRRIIPK